jgi:uncharacterized membrane protein
MCKFINSVTAVLTLLYPPAVYFGIRYVEPWQLAAILALLPLLQLLAGRAGGSTDFRLPWIALAFCGFAVLNNNPVTLLFYPALINLGLLVTFAASLYFPPPVIERLARLRTPDLPPEGVRYTRKVTQIWSLFFLLNGLTAAVTALWCDFAVWSLYNGLIAYILIGLLMAIEYGVRVRTQSYAR